MHDIIEPSHSDMPLDLAIWLPPLQAWRSVYGNGFCDEAMQACMDRLKGLGIDAQSLERAGDTLLVRGFDPRTGRQVRTAVAQPVERRPEEPGVGGSNPSCGTSF